MGNLGSRIRIIRGKTSQIHFSAEMGIPQTNLSRYERDISVPDLDFLIRLADKFEVSLEWLVAGRGAMRPGDLTEQPMPATRIAAPAAPDPSPLAACPRCAKLEAELDIERQDRRDLAAENRQLWKENAVLRERLARYEERAIKPDVEDADPQPRPLA